jgi:restriction endonuclease S subunit
MLDSGFTVSVKEKYKSILNKEFIGKILINIQNKIYNCARGHAQKNLDVDQFKSIKIPLPPLEVQKQIVAELESYQNIIDGARKVVENYKPGFKIDPDWEMVELGDVAKIEKGSLITEKTAINGKVPVIAGGQKPSYYHNQSNRQGQTITVSASGAYAGFVNYFDTPIFASDCSTIKGNEKILNTKYTYYFLKSIQEKIYDFQQGGAQPHVYPKHLQIIKIPLPSIEVQKQIVAKIEEEQKLVDSNKQLIDLFEKKVKDKISEVWGEKDGEGAGDGK